MYKFIIYISLIMPMVSCKNDTPNQGESEPVVDLPKVDSTVRPKEAPYDTVYKGLKTGMYKLKTAKMEATFTNYGARIISLKFPDKNWKMTDVVVGLPTVGAYIYSTEPYFGATIGRYANRIANGKFRLDGKEYQLDLNNGPNTLHGGKDGFHNKVWEVTTLSDTSITFRINSADMDGGFPGNMQAEVRYTLTPDNGLRIQYQAATDKACPVNLTNHAFFNLNGEGSGTILNHKLYILASNYTPVNENLIPNGQISPVKGTPFDFTVPHTIGERIGQQNEQLKFGKGYDHNFVIDDYTNKGLPVCSVQGDISGIQMVITTTEPGLQFYSGNFMQSKNSLKSLAKDDYRTAFCLETQHFPDSPNNPAFPNTVLKPGEIYKSTTKYVFSVKN